MKSSVSLQYPLKSWEYYQNGDFIACVGYLRQGKSMNAVRVAWGLHRLYPDRPVLANMPTAFGSLVRSANEMLHARNSILIWDELAASLDSRSFAKNAMATQQAIYLGKRGNILIYTVPDVGMIDVRFRILTRYLYYSERLQNRSASSIRRYIWRGAAAVPAGRLVMEYAGFMQLYDTSYEDVILHYSDSDTPPAPPSERAGGAQQPARSVVVPRKGIF
jgi:hypothetical protein